MIQSSAATFRYHSACGHVDHVFVLIGYVLYIGYYRDCYISEIPMCPLGSATIPWNGIRKYYVGMGKCIEMV